MVSIVPPPLFPVACEPAVVVVDVLSSLCAFSEDLRSSIPVGTKWERQRQQNKSEEIHLSIPEAFGIHAHEALAEGTLIAA